MANASPRSVLVWDLPTRAFHWLLVALVVCSVVTGKVGGNAIAYHMVSGCAILALLLFRIAWGFVGGRHARFASFVRGPAAVLAYAQELLAGKPAAHLGHNPLGGWSVLGMLAALALQAGTGLFVDDEIATQGPLNKYVSGATAALLTTIHRMNAKIVVALVALHVAAVVFHALARREDLVRPMLHGRKHWVGDADHGHASPILGAVIAAIAGGLVYILVTL
ncbi:MAG: cytochrome b/b6 domain-containing protein [Burkholderiales bacterium]|jgi:cytochrome b|nr:cytochrome b/b6 domain-containing protein [Burkholderiales bacterium]